MCICKGDIRGQDGLQVQSNMSAEKVRSMLECRSDCADCHSTSPADNLLCRAGGTHIGIIHALLVGVIGEARNLLPGLLFVYTLLFTAI